jgi:hypothetical protein
MQTRTFHFLFLLLLSGLGSMAQDTLILLNGKKIVAKSVDLRDFQIAYRPIAVDSKLKRIAAEKVFSVIYKDGKERIIYQPDTTDPLEFKQEEMRMFIRGEQDARTFYRNRPLLAGGFAAGVVSGMFGFYGILGPPIYSTFFGSFSPNVSKKLSFCVKGNGATNAGITPMKYKNEVVGSVSAPQFTGENKFVINGHSVQVSGTVDSCAAQINRKFNSHLVHASVVDNKLKLYRSSSTDLINNEIYREGFEKKVRDYKIRRSALAGIIGFVAGGIAFTAFYHK